MIKIFQKNRSGKTVLGLFILTNLVYGYMLLVSIPNTMAFANGMKLLDMLPAGYDFNYVTTLFTSLGNQGREAYLTRQIPVDMIYPFLFAISYSAVMAYFLKKLNKHKTAFIYLCFLPLLAGAADYIENIGIMTMLNNYPDVTETTVTITSLFSVVKSSSTSIYFLALLVVLIALGFKSFKKRNTPI